MTEDPDLQSTIEAYAPFKKLIKKLNFLARISHFHIIAIIHLWGIGCIRPISLQPRHYYHCQGIHGYAERVVPPLFEISPFFPR